MLSHLLSADKHLMHCTPQETFTFIDIDDIVECPLTSALISD